jgi:hypothetical protein
MNNSNLSLDQKVEKWNEFNNGIMGLYQHKSEQTKAAAVKEVFEENVNDAINKIPTPKIKMKHPFDVKGLHDSLYPNNDPGIS